MTSNIENQINAAVEREQARQHKVWTKYYQKSTQKSIDWWGQGGLTAESMIIEIHGMLAALLTFMAGISLLGMVTQNFLWAVVLVACLLSLTWPLRTVLASRKDTKRLKDRQSAFAHGDEKVYRLGRQKNELQYRIVIDQTGSGFQGRIIAYMGDDTSTVESVAIAERHEVVTLDLGQDYEQALESCEQIAPWLHRCRQQGVNTHDEVLALHQKQLPGQIRQKMDLSSYQTAAKSLTNYVNERIHDDANSQIEGLSVPTLRDQNTAAAES